MYLLFFCFFFFQAEDGIRDIGVTGVQTCALPIYSNPRPRPWQGRALPLSYSRATAPHGITDQLASARRASAASSGGTGLMKNPLPHSNPATLVSFGMTSRCQWNDSSSPPRRGAVWSMKLNGG